MWCNLKPPVLHCKFHSFTFLRFYIGAYYYSRPNTIVYNRAAFQISAPGGTFARCVTVNRRSFSHSDHWPCMNSTMHIFQWLIAESNGIGTGTRRNAVPTLAVIVVVTKFVYWVTDGKQHQLTQIPLKKIGQNVNEKIKQSMRWP